MTREEFIAKYGDVKVKFVSYYKYTFTYSGTCVNGFGITVDVGGDSGDIYRLDVGIEEVPIYLLDISSGEVYDNGTYVEGFYS